MSPCRHETFGTAVCRDVVYHIIRSLTFWGQGISRTLETGWPCPPFSPFQSPRISLATCPTIGPLPSIHLLWPQHIGGSSSRPSEESPAIAAGSRTSVRGGGAIWDHKSQLFGGLGGVEFSLSLAFHPIDRLAAVTVSVKVEESQKRQPGRSSIGLGKEGGRTRAS